MKTILFVIQPFRWWHGLAIFMIANAISVLPAGINGDEAFYNNFVRPAIAPPDWLFVPMWFFLNVTSLIALAMVVNSNSQTHQKQTFIKLEIVGWVLFAVFNTLYFWIQSPILGAIDTVFGLLIALFNFLLAWRIDRRAATMIGFRVLWLLLATYVSVYVALNNTDVFFASFSR